MNQVQRGIVHPVELVDLQHPGHRPREAVHNVSVSAVEGGLPPGDEIQVEIHVLVPGKPVGQLGVHAVGDSLLQHGLIEYFPGKLRALSHRGKHDDPGIKLVCGQKKPRQRVKNQGLVLRRLLLLFLFGLPSFFLLAPNLFQPGRGHAEQSCAQPVPLLLHNLLRQNAVLIQTNPGQGQIALFLPAEVVELIDRMLLRQIQHSRIRDAAGRRLRNGFRRMSLLLKALLLFRRLRFGTEQKLRELVFQ